MGRSKYKWIFLTLKTLITDHWSTEIHNASDLIKNIDSNTKIMEIECKMPGVTGLITILLSVQKPQDWKQNTWYHLSE